MGIVLAPEHDGDLGCMEIMAFHQVATPTQSEQFDDLLAADNIIEAWALVKRVTGTGKKCPCKCPE